VQWWQASSMNRNAPNEANTKTALEPVTPADPVEHAALNAHVLAVKRDLKTRMGLGGPGLTTAAFNLGMNQVTHAMEQASTEHLQFQRDRMETSFTDRHGDALAQQMQRLCDAADDAHLPEVHRLIAKTSSKSHHYGVLTSYFARRAEESTVPLTASNAPIPTTKLTEEVFRSFDVAGTGLIFGKGLTPFAIVCEGHEEALEVQRLTKKAELAESGSAMTLNDAETLVSKDPRFPTEAYIACEKLYGWSVVVDVFHGEATAIATNARQMAVQVAPAFHRIVANAPTPAVGMDLVARILYDAQQECFAWVNLRSSTPAGGAAVPAPTYDELIRKVQTFRVQSLSALPSSWSSRFEAPSTKNSKQGRPGNTGSTAEVYSRADSKLLKRFRDSQYNTITDMVQGQDVTIPKHNGSEVCLSWALKGKCTSTCKRAGNHVSYGQDTNKQLHAMLTKCGVAAAQE